MIGEVLYGITRQEARSAPVIQRGTFLNALAAAATNVDLTFGPLVQDKIFWLTHVQLAGIAGAGQILQRLEVAILDVSGNGVLSGPSFLFNPALAAAQTGVFSAGCEILIMPTEQVRFRGIFSAGGVNNTLSASAHGFYLPKGNMQVR